LPRLRLASSPGDEQMYDSSRARALSPAHCEPMGTPQDQARELIGRYPNLSETELARLINLLPRLFRTRYGADPFG
jgi:hypothetical protein